MTTADGSGTERRMTVGGYRLHVSIRGEGRPVLLMNGLGGNIALWDAMHADLVGMQVISFDAPGIGLSSKPRKPYSMASMAQLAAKLLDRLGLDQVDVVGYSFGGALAQQFAHDHPERVRRLVLGATLPGWGVLPGELTALLSIVTPVRYYSKKAYALTAPYLAGGKAEKDAEFVERTAAARVQAPPSLGGYTLQLMAAWSWSSLPWLHHIEHPTFVVTGVQDRLIPAVNSEVIASRLPHARLMLIEDWGHYVLFDQRSGAGTAIADFLRAEHHEDSDAWRSSREVTCAEAEAAASRHHNLLTRLYWPHSMYRRWHTRDHGLAVGRADAC